MIFFADTHKGKVRPVNEDAFYIPEQGGFLALVADGMGGHSAGEVASRLFVQTAVQSLSGMDPSHISQQDIKAAFDEANKNVWQQARTTPKMHGMGTTATLAVFDNDRVLIGHVGDSRAYLLSNGVLKQITKDHSYVQSLVDRGFITKEDAESHPQKNIITRAIGTEKGIETDIYAIDMKPNDALLLCTDGLFGMVSDMQIQAILNEGLKNAAMRLIDAALEGGGRDNITVVIAAMDGGLV